MTDYLEIPGKRNDHWSDRMSKVSSSQRQMKEQKKLCKNQIMLLKSWRKQDIFLCLWPGSLSHGMLGTIKTVIKKISSQWMAGLIAPVIGPIKIKPPHLLRPIYLGCHKTQQTQGWEWKLYMLYCYHHVITIASIMLYCYHHWQYFSNLTGLLAPPAVQCKERGIVLFPGGRWSLGDEQCTTGLSSAA